MMLSSSAVVLLMRWRAHDAAADEDNIMLYALTEEDVRVGGGSTQHVAQGSPPHASLPCLQIRVEWRWHLDASAPAGLMLTAPVMLFRPPSLRHVQAVIAAKPAITVEDAIEELLEQKPACCSSLRKVPKHALAALQAQHLDGVLPKCGQRVFRDL
jgi:hypothetical protein